MQMNRHSLSSRRSRLLLILGVMFFLSATLLMVSLQRKNGRPIQMKPLSQDGILYKVTRLKSQNGMEGDDLVEVWDEQKNELLWKNWIYRHDSSCERCPKEPVFITDIQVQGDLLIIKNNQGEYYRVEKKTGRAPGVLPLAFRITDINRCPSGTMSGSGHPAVLFPLSNKFQLMFCGFQRKKGNYHFP